MWLLVLLLGLSAQSVPTAEAPLEHRLQLVAQINQDRREAGVPPVEYSAELARAAAAHCQEMLREGYMSHWDRAGRKPYLRYSQAGIRDATQENVWSLWQTNFDTSAYGVRQAMREAHRSFMAEQPPFDGHRRSVLDPRHTHVGIGVAYDARGMRLVELFAARYVALEPVAERARLRDFLTVEGRVLEGGVELYAVSVYYEPLPQPMTPEELRATGSYGLPSEEQIERLGLSDMRYLDGTMGTIAVDAKRRFRMPLRFWKGKPGVYTVAVWVREGGRKPFIGAMTAVVVEDEPRKQ